MEYFLQLSILAMVISSISILLIDYQKPETTTEPENDQSSSNPTGLMDDSAEEFLATESQKQSTNNTPTKDKVEESTRSKLHTTKDILKEIKRVFSMMWTLQKSIFYY